MKFNKAAIEINETNISAKKVRYMDSIVLLLAYVYTYGRYYDEFQKDGLTVYKSRKNKYPISKYSYSQVVEKSLSFFNEGFFESTDLVDRMFGAAQLRKIDKQFYMFKICRMEYTRDCIINQEVIRLDDKRHYEYLGCKTIDDIKQAWEKVFYDKEFILKCLKTNHQDPFLMFYCVWKELICNLKPYIEQAERENNDFGFLEDYTVDILLEECKKIALGELELVHRQTSNHFIENLSDEVSLLKPFILQLQNKEAKRLYDDILKKTHELRFFDIDNVFNRIDYFKKNNYDPENAEDVYSLESILNTISEYPDASAYLMKLKRGKLAENISIREMEQKEKEGPWREYYLNNRTALNDFVECYKDPENSYPESFKERHPYVDFLVNIVTDELSARLTFEE